MLFRSSEGRAGLFTIPEELCVPRELADKAEALKGRRRYDPLNIPEEEGFRRAVLDPLLNALHRAMNRRLRGPLNP